MAHHVLLPLVVLLACLKTCTTHVVLGSLVTICFDILQLVWDDVTKSLRLPLELPLLVDAHLLL